VDDDKKPFHNPFAALEALRGSLPEPPPSSATPPPTPASPSREATGSHGPAPRSVPRAVVRLERSGRGGKEVTVVDHLEIAPVERERWLKALKAALGCGGQIEGGSLMFQGDQRDRLAKLLSDRGVKKVTVAGPR